jgi:hypothetical protein
MKIVWLALWSLLPGSSGLAQALKKQHRLQLFSWDEVEDGVGRSRRWRLGGSDFLKPFEEKGERVTVEQGDSKAVNLVTIKTPVPSNKSPSPPEIAFPRNRWFLTDLRDASVR